MLQTGSKQTDVTRRAVNLREQQHCMETDQLNTTTSDLTDLITYNHLQQTDQALTISLVTDKTNHLQSLATDRPCPYNQLATDKWMILTINYTTTIHTKIIKQHIDLIYLHL